MIKPIPGYLNYYASDDGRIYGSSLYRDGRLYEIVPYISLGYKRVCIRVNNHPVDKSVAFLIALTFVDSYQPNFEVNHKNKNRLDNRPINLEWLTRKQNVRYSIAKAINVRTKSGLVLTYESITDFANDIGISISNIVRHYIKKHHGYMAKWGLYIWYKS